MPQFRVDYGDAVIAEGYFLKRQRPPQPVGQYADIEGAFFRHLSTFSDRSTIKEAVLDLLRQARRHVFFCSFILTDEEVLNALLETSRRLNGHVYVLTTLKDDDFKEAVNEDEQDYATHFGFVRQLTSKGLLIKARSDCHAKFMTVDDNVAIVTSANAEPTAYGNVRVDRINGENGVLYRTPREVKRLSNFFRALWKTACNYYVAPDATVFEVLQIQSGTPHVKPVEPREPAEEGEALWTAPGDPRILRRLLAMIRKAKRSVSLSTFHLKGIDVHELGAAIGEASSRGVRFQVLVRGMNQPKRSYHRQQCYLLARELGRNGVILGDFWNHSKAFVADSDEAMVLTANLDARHGLDHGVEVGFYSRQPLFVGAVNTYLDRLSNAAAFEFVTDPTQAMMADRYGGRRGQQLEGIIRIAVPTREKPLAKLVGQWCDAARRQLVRVAKRQTERGGEELVLFTDVMTIHTHPGEGGSFVAHEINDRPSAEDLGRFDSYLGRGTVVCDVYGD